MSELGIRISHIVMWYPFGDSGVYLVQQRTPHPYASVPAPNPMSRVLNPIPTSEVQTLGYIRSTHAYPACQVYVISIKQTYVSALRRPL